jgi:hypothetical protein
MSKPVTIVTTRHATHDELAFAGPLAEAFGAAVPKVPKDLKPKLVIDLYGVTSVNSMGIRDWVALITTLQVGREITFRRCSPTFVLSANVVMTMWGRGTVESVCRGYECRKGHYWWKEIALAGFDPSKADKVSEPCATCAMPGTPEDRAEDFFQFLEFIGENA